MKRLLFTHMVLLVPPVLSPPMLKEEMLYSGESSNCMKLKASVSSVTEKPSQVESYFIAMDAFSEIRLEMTQL